MIDPIETIIKFLATELTCVEGRVAAKHRYGSGWADGANGVSVHADGGEPDLYAAAQHSRVELRLYGSGTVATTEIYMALIDLSRSNERVVVATSGGNAFVQYFVPESGLSMLYDEALNMDMGVVFFGSLISEEAVP